jgi:hypothetical protein
LLPEAESRRQISATQFSDLLQMAANAGVSEFEAGPFKVKFSQAALSRWALLNRVAVDGKGRTV